VIISSAVILGRFIFVSNRRLSYSSSISPFSSSLSSLFGVLIIIITANYDLLERILLVKCLNLTEICQIAILIA